MVYVSQIIMLYSKSSTYKWVLFQEQVGKSNHLFVKSTKVSLSIQLTQSGYMLPLLRLLPGTLSLKQRYHVTLYSACMLSRFSHIWLFVILLTVACQAPLSMGFIRQEYWGELPCPPPSDLPNPGIKSKSHISCTGKQLLLPLMPPMNSKVPNSTRAGRGCTYMTMYARHMS